MSSNDRENDETGNDRNVTTPVEAVCYFPDNHSLPNSSQPRQPRNLQDLLRYATEAADSTPRSANENQPRVAPLDEESKNFLEEALKSMTVDVIGELTQSIKVLQRVNDLFEDCEDVSLCEAALDHILDYVDNIDIANDFFKIGGFAILKPCLNSAISSIRWRGAELVACLCQNNPFCQAKVSEDNILPTLLQMIDLDVNNVCRVKALYAVSCLVRENEVALKEFSETDGYSILLKALQSKVEKLNIKAAFLLSALCSQKPEIKDELISMGYVEQLIGQLALGMQIESDKRTETGEYLLSALLSIVENHDESQALCRNPDYQFKEILNFIIENAQGKEDRTEEFGYAHTLLKLIYKDQGCNSVEDR